jgi:hypothetical protein
MSITVIPYFNDVGIAGRIKADGLSNKAGNIKEITRSQNIR